MVEEDNKKCTTCDGKGSVNIRNENGAFDKFACPDCTTLPMSDEVKEKIRERLNGVKK